jgi:phenylacetate-CoA ligase
VPRRLRCNNYFKSTTTTAEALQAGRLPHHRFTRPGRLDELTVRVEAAEGVTHPARREAMAREVASRVKRRVGVTVKVEVLDPHALERSLGKAKRISDQRDLH